MKVSRFFLSEIEQSLPTSSLDVSPVRPTFDTENSRRVIEWAFTAHIFF